jgi:hypothetical protein
MLSGMESYDETLRLADRAAAAPYTELPRTPGWYPVAMAGYFTLVAGTFPLLREGQILLGVGLLLGAIIAVSTLTMILRVKLGTWPRLSTAPSEIKRAYGLFIVLALIALIISSAVWMWFGDIAGLVAVFLTTLTVVWAYEFRLYPAAAQQVRQRLT